MRREIIVISLLHCSVAGLVKAQFDQPLVPHPSSGGPTVLKADTDEEGAARAQFLNQGSVTVTSATPKISVQALTYYLGISDKRVIPFYLASTLPTVSDTTLKNTSESLLNEFGGLASASIGYYGKLSPFGLFKFKDDANLGLFVDFRGGTRLDDLGRGATDLHNLEAFAYSVGLIKVILPVFNDKKGKTRAGDVSAGLSFAGLLSLSGELKPTGVTDAFNALGYLNATLSVNITNALVFKAGKTLTTTRDQLPDRWFVGGSIIPSARRAD